MAEGGSPFVLTMGSKIELILFLVPSGVEAVGKVATVLIQGIAAESHYAGFVAKPFGQHHLLRKGFELLRGEQVSETQYAPHTEPVVLALDVGQHPLDALTQLTQIDGRTPD